MIYYLRSRNETPVATIPGRCSTVGSVFFFTRARVGLPTNRYVLTAAAFRPPAPVWGFPYMSRVRPTSALPLVKHTTTHRSAYSAF